MEIPGEPTPAPRAPSVATRSGSAVRCWTALKASSTARISLTSRSRIVVPTTVVEVGDVSELNAGDDLPVAARSDDEGPELGGVEAAVDAPGGDQLVVVTFLGDA